MPLCCLRAVLQTTGYSRVVSVCSFHHLELISAALTPDESGCCRFSDMIIDHKPLLSSPVLFSWSTVLLLILCRLNHPNNLFPEPKKINDIKCYKQWPWEGRWFITLSLITLPNFVISVFQFKLLHSNSIYRDLFAHVSQASHYVEMDWHHFLSTYFALFMDLTEMKFNIIGFLIYF